MAIVAVQNIISVIDGKPITDNVINKEVLADVSPLAACPSE